MTVLSGDNSYLNFVAMELRYIRILFAAIALYLTISGEIVKGNDTDLLMPAQDTVKHSVQDTVQLFVQDTVQGTAPLKALDCLTNIPDDWVRFGRAAWRTENIPMYAGIAVSTVAAVIYDHELYIPVRNWYQSSKTAAFWQDRGVDIGDGKFQFGIAAGFGLYGWIYKDDRALRTASQVTEVILAAGTVIQILKHSTGRESPFVATTPTGRWRVFPNQIDYLYHVPHYDAYPSGHVCTALATLTVVMENYPEAKWLPYVGYAAITWLAVGMVGQGIHWVSDYPLSIAIGYGFAQIVAHKKLFASGSVAGDRSLSTEFLPYLTADGVSGVTLQLTW